MGKIIEAIDDAIGRALSSTDKAIGQALDATDRAFGAGLDAGGRALEHHVINPVGEVIGTMIGDKESAKALGNRALGELTGIGGSNADDED